MNKTKKITFTALKGGTGKTIITFNVATILAREYDKKCLIIDVDPQHNMTNLLTSEVEMGTEDIFKEDMYGRAINAKSVIQSSHIENIDVIGTSIKLTGTEVQISGAAGRELIFKNWISDNSEYLSKYDYIFFDTNPTMSVVNINSFIASDSIILVSDIDIDAINAVDTFLDLYYPIQFRLDRKSEGNVKGLLINKVQSTTNMDRDFIEYINADDFEYKDWLIETKIHDAVAIRETKVNRQPIQKQRNLRSYKEFHNVIDELLRRGVL